MHEAISKEIKIEYKNVGQPIGHSTNQKLKRKVNERIEDLKEADLYVFHIVWKVADQVKNNLIGWGFDQFMYSDNENN